MWRTPQVRVVIGDRQGPSGLGERLALGAVGFDIVEECVSAEAAIAAVRLRRPDVCLVDRGLFDEAVSPGRIPVQLGAATRVVIVAETASADDVLDALEAGVAGFLLADVTPERLAQHMSDVADGRLALSPALVRPVLQRLRDELDRPAPC